jgi:hypothetical protein
VTFLRPRSDADSRSELLTSSLAWERRGNSTHRSRPKSEWPNEDVSPSIVDRQGHAEIAEAWEYRLEYRLVSEPCISLHFVAARLSHSYCKLLLTAGRCSCSARTFNPTHVTDAGIEENEPNVHRETRLRSGSKRAANDL